MDLTKIRGIGLKWSEKLKAAGINSVKDPRKYSAKDLVEKVGVSKKIASKWLMNADEILSKNNV